jgi:AhpD family alkylhydroperoxidase
MNYRETLEDIRETMGIVPGFMKALPEQVLVNDWALWKKYSMEESVIPKKYRELMGLAVAANIKCPYCQAMHTAFARFHGATDDEMREIYFLASLTSRWSAMIHAQNYELDKFQKEAAQIGEHLGKKSKK